MYSEVFVEICQFGKINRVDVLSPWEISVFYQYTLNSTGVHYVIHSAAGALLTNDVLDKIQRK